jgi:LytS/YehU family sensor histidine kinase
LLAVLCSAGISIPAIQQLQAAKHAPDAIPVNEHGIPEFSENPLAPPTPAKSAPPRPLIEEKLLVYGNFAIKFILTFLLSLGLRIYGRWQTAEEEKYKAELSFLKAQINPHFLFNTLNGIYVMAIKKSDKTAGAIMKLSSIMRYVINEGHHELVPLEKEINYISDYVELQKMRLAPNIHLNMDIRISNTSYKIAPLLLIPFIENAFKHGISTEKECTIHIQIVQKNKELSLLVENDKIHTTLKDEEKSGIGVENTKQRLQLLYEGKHQLKISETASTYTISLKIMLT